MAHLLSFTRNGWAALRNAAVAIIALGVLGGCATGWPFFEPEGDRVEAFRMVPVDAVAWTPPTAITAIDRKADRARETAFILENHTALDGENTLLLISYPESRPPAFEFEKLLERLPGDVTPFESDDYTSLRRSNDAHGGFVWIERRINDVTCVLAMRRLEPGQRPIELGIGTTDVVLRNCVEDGREAALSALAFLPHSGMVSPISTTKNLSVLAAPISDDTPLFPGVAR